MRRLATGLLALAAGIGVALATGNAVAQTTASPSSATKAGTATTASSNFSTEQLDQMMAPIALYPDSLLAQVLMASTYPGDVADAVAWSKAHPDAKGETAVKQVANESWDPSVQSLVAFPQLLAVLGQDGAWVQRMGDAFLAQPDDVMASVQRLRKQADAAGNLKSNEQQTVSTQAVAAGAATTGSQQVIVIEPKDPEVVYVPSYNPSVVYGSWAYPSYPPYYYPPPAYYYPGAALFSFGIGVAVGGALWGNCNWGGGDIDIDVNRYNNFNSNRQINRGDNTWKHNAANRDGVPYRDNASREKFGRQLDGAGQRDNYRGRDQARTAERDRARQSLEKGGFQAPAASNREARERAGQAGRELDRQPGGRQAAGNAQRPSTANNMQSRQGARERQPPGMAQNNNAFQGARDPGQSRAASQRGQGSFNSSQRPASSRGGGHQMSRPSRPPSRGGGGGRRR
ncbi:DUF3300 domain-containing protein [Pseudoxanthomonas indica]|uniref:DUF3300 domain-containing protein n=1 Tax=Pseudoxanthomonas indica TaxID=428993 RepID=A0A1T5K2B2_9GAMM|nr:DUF3300 domain-containing protein [Pseudoxanthomonas indica]GGD45986.1 membrane protein [Pseudoxanthomonas indica]SKC57655.1 Protein of unknown function [Pseudoxanthomonas indica]